MNQLFAGLFEHSTSNACVVDLTPPTFAGITGLVPQPTGALLASWSAGTDATLPIQYEVYIQPNTATGLFSLSNIVLITNNLTAQIFTLADSSQLVNGVTYYVGVRAVDAVGNRDSNLVSLSDISTGVIAGTVQYTVHAGFSITAANMLQLEFWVKANGVYFNNPSLLGVANYTIRDATDATVGITQSGITVNANGKYLATPVGASALIDLTHYIVDFGIIVDGIERKSAVAITLGE